MHGQPKHCHCCLEGHVEGGPTRTVCCTAHSLTLLCSYVYICEHMLTCVYVRVNILMYACIHTYVHVCTYVYAGLCTYLSTVCVCIGLCMCVLKMYWYHMSADDVYVCIPMCKYV